MVGRDLIIYILENRLEDEPVFKDGKFIGFMTEDEAAAKNNIGVGSIKALVSLGVIEGIRIEDKIFIEANTKLRKETDNV